MTTLPDRPNIAVLVVDVQVGVVADAHEREAVLGNIAAVVEKARKQAAPVIWVQHENEQLVPGADAWRIAPELSPAEGEPRIDKFYGDCFEETRLEALLGELQVGRLLVAGAQTDQCIRATLHGALLRGYDTVLVSDAHTTSDLSQWGAPPPGQVIAHTNLYWKYERAPGREAGTVTTAAADFAGRA